jgi:hypothetical protein
MSKYAYAEIASFKEPLMVFPKGAASADPSRINKDVSNTILMSRTDFTVKIVDVPPLPEDQLKAMLAYRIKSLHPGDPARTAFDYLLLPWRGAHYAVLFITPIAVRDSYRHLGETNRLILPFQLLKRSILECDRDEAYFLFWHRHWIDMFAIKAGKPAASYVIKRTTGLKHDLSKIMKLLSPGPSGALFTHYCGQDETTNIEERFSAVYPDHDVRFVPFEELFRTDIARKDTLFLKRKPIRLPRLRRRLAIYGAMAAVLAVALFFRFVEHQQAYRDKLKGIETSLTEKNKDLAAKLKEMRNLEKEYAGLRGQKPVDLYRLLAELSAVFPADAAVQSVVVKTNAFQLEGTGSHPLVIEQKLKDHPLFSAIEVTEMKPVPGSDRQMFRMKGVFTNEKAQ